MPQYFSTFITGFQEVVRNALQKQFKDVEIKLLLDGLVVYSTNAPFQNIKAIRFFNNNYYLLRYFDQLKNDSIEYMMQSILNDKKAISSLPRGVIGKATSFRIVASKENQTVSPNSNLLIQTEKLFSYQWNLKVNRSLPDVEVWFLLRSEGSGFVGIRIREKNNFKKTIAKGELRPELANLLCWISDPEKDDVFLDPFAGSGAIPAERAKSFPYQKIIASDLNQELFNQLNQRLHKVTNRVILGKWDALNLTEIEDRSVDKLVTDPPWGLFSHRDVDLQVFYTNMLEEFGRVLKTGGLLIVLTAQKGLFERALDKDPKLKPTKKFDILVSGKKAAIYKVQKLN